MSLDVSTLVDYVIENENLLITKSLFTSRTSDLIRTEGTVMTGIKFAEQINILSTDAIFQNGDGCTRTSSGTTSITQRKVTVGNIAIVEDICVKDLRKKYMSKKLSAGSQENQIPFEQDYTNLKTETIAEQVETALWQGDTTSVDANLNKFDGLVKLIDAAAASVNGNPTNIASGTGITTSNIKTIVDNMWGLLPARVKGKNDVRVFCGWDTFTTFIQAYRDQNLFSFAPTGKEIDASNGEVVIPGTNIKLTAVHGLDATNRLFALRMSNLFEGTDLENEEEKWSIMEDQFKDYVRFKAAFKMGVNVAFPNEIVQFKLV